MRRSTAFTLVELLVVIAVLGLLVTIIMPTLGRVRDLAKRTLCSMQLSAYGRASATYVGAYGCYPHYGPENLPFGWPKIHGLLQIMTVPGTTTRSDGLMDYQWDLAEAWAKAYCPAMDLAEMWEHVDEALLSGQGTLAKPSLFPAGYGYQWNHCLRAPGPPAPWIPTGRWPASCWVPPPSPDPATDWDNTQWIDFPIVAPGGTYVSQATHPQDIDEPSACAEAWDGFDPDSTPNVVFGGWDVENLAPGWHVGPQCRHTGGWAFLNGGRHPHSPNVLYADGSVRADATRRLAPSDVASWPGTRGSLAGMKVNSWGDFDGTFGTMHHIAPRRAIMTGMPN